MGVGRLILTGLLAGALALSACGLKGDPVRPEPKEDKKTEESGS